MRSTISFLAIVLLAGGLIGCGNAAAQPAGTDTAAFAPSDLAFTIPRVIGDKHLEVKTLTSDQIHTMFESGDNDKFRSVLVQHGKDASDMSAAAGQWSEDTEALIILAVRVAGVDGSELLDLAMGARQEGAPTTPPFKGRDISGKHVRDYATPLTTYGYPKGEVLYLIMAASAPDADAALAALP